MCIEFVVRADQTRLCGGGLTADMQAFAAGADAAHAVKQRAHDIEFHLERRVKAFGRHACVYSATECRIEQGGKPAAMNAAQRIVMPSQWLALENGHAGLDMQQQKIQRGADSQCLAGVDTARRCRGSVRRRVAGRGSLVLR